MGRNIDPKDSPNDAAASIGGKDDNGRNGRFQRFVQIGKGLQIEHMYLVDEQHAGHQLCNALVNVFVHNLVDLHTQLVC